MALQSAIRWTVGRSTGPSIEPITVAEAKRQANVEIDDDDAWFESQIAAARIHAEEVELGRTLITTSWTLRADEFPDVIELPFPPIASVTSVKYYDTDGVQQTLTANTDYQVDAKSEPGRIAPAYGTVWPTTRAIMNAVEVIYAAGYGAATTDVPENIRHALRLIVAHWYERREETTNGRSIAKVPMAAAALLAGVSAKGFT